MHSSPFDLYHTGISPVHGLDARVKLVLALAFVLCVSLTPVGAWPVYLLLLAVTLSAAELAELGLGLVLRRSLLALPFALAALPLLVTLPGPTFASLRIGRFLISISGPGMERFVSIVFRSWLSVQMAILLTATTPLPDLLVAFGALRLPRLLVAILALMWRYLAVLIDEALRMMRARDARSGCVEGRGGGSLRWRASVTGAMAGSLFLRGFERSERIHSAMLSRGYDGTIRSLSRQPPDSRSWRLMVLGLAVLAGLLLLGYRLG